MCYGEIVVNMIINQNVEPAREKNCSQIEWEMTRKKRVEPGSGMSRVVLVR